jgi:hypothetical protein
LCLLYALVGALIARTYLRRFLQARDPAHDTFGSFIRCMALYRVLLLGVYALQVYVLLWPSCVRYDLRLGEVFLAEKLLVLAPLFVALLLSWIPLYRLDRMLRGSDWSRRAYLVFQARLSIGPVLGLVVLLHLAFDGVLLLPGLERLLARIPAIEVVLLLGTLLLVLFFVPVILRGSSTPS